MQTSKAFSQSDLSEGLTPNRTPPASPSPEVFIFNGTSSYGFVLFCPPATSPFLRDGTTFCLRPPDMVSPRFPGLWLLYLVFSHPFTSPPPRVLCLSRTAAREEKGRRDITVLRKTANLGGYIGKESKADIPFGMLIQLALELSVSAANAGFRADHSESIPMRKFPQTPLTVIAVSSPFFPFKSCIVSREISNFICV